MLDNAAKKEDEKIILDDDAAKVDDIQEISELHRQIKDLKNNYALQLKQIEEAFNKERSVFKKIIDSLPDAIYVKDINYRKIIANLSEIHSTGYKSEEEILGKTDHELYPKELADSFSKDDKVVIQNGKPILNKEEQIIDAEGRKIYRLTSKLPLRNNKGDIIGLIGIGHNITETKLIQEALQKEQILLRTLINNIPDAVYVKDAECRKTITNPADLQNVGKTKQEEVLGKDDFDLFPKEIAQRFYADDLSVIKTGNPILNKEEFLKKQSGEKRWLLTSKLPLKNEKDEVVGLIGIGRDITERKLFEQTLENERNLLKQLIDNSPDLISLKNLKGQYILNNEAQLKCIGVKKQKEALGKTTMDFLPKDTALKFDAYEMEVMLKGTSLLDLEDVVYNYEYGEYRWYSVSRIPLKDSRGNVTGILSIAHDITNRKKADDVLKKTYSELEKTNNALQKANEIKGQFVANMSHEIRTPLNAIIGLTGLLKETELDNEQTDYVETIHNSGDILLSLINDILDFSKIEAEKIELEKQPFDLRNCIEDALDLIAPKATEKHLELAYSIENGISTKLIGDVTRLRQILVNLLSNSIKFTDHGEVILSVNSQLLDHNSYNLHFSVRDTGIGISPEQQEKLFQSFTQVDASTTRKFGGTGLGLAISKRLSELMGGSMWIESSGIAGKGTIFHFTIVAEISADKGKEKNSTALIGKKILIVDDNKTNREILTQQMRSLKIIPSSVESGQQALELLKSGEKFDIAILDYHMPEMDGITLSNEISKLLNEKTPPMILLSSYGYRSKNNSLPLFAATLTKPLKFSHMENALITVLRKNQSSIRKIDLTPIELDEGLGKQCPLRILLSEDNKINQKVALKILEKLGYRADVASNGLEVIDALKRQTYDVILMDIQMPEMDGVQATIKIRNMLKEIKQPQIIAMTANALKTDREKYISVGMNDYVVKPFKVEDLVSVLMKCYLASIERAKANGAKK